MQGIAILANEHLVPSKCRNCLSAKQATVENSLSIARVLRHFVLVPCEICVVPYRHGKIAVDWNDIPLANRESMGVSLHIVCNYLSSVKLQVNLHFDTPRHKRICASLCSFKCGDWAARPATGHKITASRKKEPYLLVWFFFSNRQLSILPGRFQPSTFDV